MYYLVPTMQIDNRGKKAYFKKYKVVTTKSQSGKNGASIIKTDAIHLIATATDPNVVLFQIVVYSQKKGNTHIHNMLMYL